MRCGPAASQSNDARSSAVLSMYALLDITPGATMGFGSGALGQSLTEVLFSA